MRVTSPWTHGGSMLVLLALLAGCDVAGPWKHRGNPLRVDQPGLSLAEQQQRSLDRLAIPQAPGPTTEFDRPGVHGR